MKKKNIRKKAGALIVTVAFLLVTTTTMITDAVILPMVKTNGHGVDPGNSILWRKEWIDGAMDTTGGKVATDSNNNAITYVWSGAEEQYLIIKYSANGAIIWSLPVDLTGVTGVTSTLLLGEEEAPPNPLYADGSVQIEMIQKNFLMTDKHFWINSICTDPNDNIIIVGEYWQQNPEPPNFEYVYVFKYDPDGNEIWKHSYTYEIDSIEYMFPGLDADIDTQGCVYVSCFTLPGTFLMKLNPDGDLCWFERIKILPFAWFPFSVALDSNENPIVSSLYGLVLDPENETTFSIGLTKFESISGTKIVDSVIEIPIDLSMLMSHDAGLTVDKTTNNVFFGFGAYLCKVDPSLENILWETTSYPYYLNDLKVSRGNLIACGGWCDVGGVTNYYAAIHDVDNGVKRLGMALGPILYCDDWFFQRFFNQLQGVAVDTNGDLLFTGGEGGMVIIKVHLAYLGGQVYIPDGMIGV